MKDMGEASYVIDIKIHRDRFQGILGLSQETYINKVLERFRMKNCSPSVSPIVKGDRFNLDQCPKNDLEREQMKNIPYASAVGSLINPGNDHWKAAKKVMRYLQGTKDYKLMYRRTNNLEVVGYLDSDFAGCVDSHKSTSGYIFILAGGAISWRSVKSLSIYCDNSAAVFMGKNNKSGSRSKHIDIKYLAIRERVKEKNTLTTSSTIPLPLQLMSTFHQLLNMVARATWFDGSHCYKVFRKWSRTRSAVIFRIYTIKTNERLKVGNQHFTNYRKLNNGWSPFVRYLAMNNYDSFMWTVDTPPSLIMDGYTTMLCYTSGEIIDCEFGVCYNRPPENGVSLNNMMTFDELECHALNINHTYTKLNMVFQYSVPFPNGNGTVNYISLPIRDDGDVSIMFNVVAQSSPLNTIEMYCQTSSIDHHSMPSSFTTPKHIEGVGPSQQMVEENTSSPMYMQSYDNDMEPIVRVDLARVTNSVVMIVENYVDILPGNDDDNVDLFNEDYANEDIMDMEDNENNENT
uniref:Retrovirus-related Pol polyprotein from transposon TNT 1-94 n=2 Tax=Vitis vinifera TaxID=29760 RepID=A5B0G9_VITVI|nr:hypothetical protein VITISV_009019 [Vitis vinifera]